MNNDFTEKYNSKIEGTISCYDRLIIQGSLSRWGFLTAMNNYMLSNGIPIFDYINKLAKPYRDELMSNIEAIARQEGSDIFYISKPSGFNKEHFIENIIKERGNSPGIVKMLSTLEVCNSYQPHFDMTKNLPRLKARTTVCLHYYIYFIDSMLGLCFFRIPTYIPFKIQFYCNGHNYLANKLERKNIGFQMNDNAFTHITDYQRAQEISDNIRAEEIHSYLDKMISRYVPFLDKTFQEYHWSINQAEYSTDIIFKNKESLYYIYEQLNRNCILSVKPGNVVTYFDRKLTLGYYGQIGSKYNKSIQGIRIKHYMGANSIKIYNKFPTVLRIETTINSLREIYILRDVLQKNKQVVTKPAIMKKSIYSLFVLSKFCKAANSRYLDFISSFEDNSDGRKNLEKVSEKVTKDDRSYRGFNFFDNLDVQILLSLTSGELNINGFRNKFLRKKLGKTSSAVTRIIKRLLLHHIIKKVNNTYKYHLTKLGRRVLSAGFVVKELKIIPALAA